jgi:DNA-binding NarL/FixJ family response regulator
VLETTELLECDRGEDGNSAIAEIEANSPDTVLLDIGHPILNGLKLGKKISRTFPKTGVVILSTNPEEDDNELFEVAKIGAVAYLRSKQPVVSELIKVIKRASNGERPINDEVINNPKVAWLILRQFQDMASMAGTIEAVAFPPNLEEIRVLKLIAKGNQKKRIASILGVSERTITERVNSVLRKLTNNDRANDMFLRSRKNLLSIQIARNGNLLIFDTPPTSGQPQSLCDAVPQH